MSFDGVTWLVTHLAHGEVLHVDDDGLGVDGFAAQLTESVHLFDTLLWDVSVVADEGLPRHRHHQPFHVVVAVGGYPHCAEGTNPASEFRPSHYKWIHFRLLVLFPDVWFLTWAPEFIIAAHAHRVVFIQHLRDLPIVQDRVDLIDFPPLHRLENVGNFFCFKFLVRIYFGWIGCWIQRKLWFNSLCAAFSRPDPRRNCELPPEMKRERINHIGTPIKLIGSINSPVSHLRRWLPSSSSRGNLQSATFSLNLIRINRETLTEEKMGRSRPPFRHKSTPIAAETNRTRKHAMESTSKVDLFDRNEIKMGMGGGACGVGAGGGGRAGLRGRGSKAGPFNLRWGRSRAASRWDGTLPCCKIRY